MRNSIYHNLLNEKQYKASTGLNKEEFNLLLNNFKKLYVSKKSNPYSPEKTAILTDAGEALFFILHYYKSYPTLQNLGLYFGFSEYTASQYIDYLKPILKATLKTFTEITPRLFKNQQEFDTVFKGVEEIFIDVTEIPTQRPENEETQKENYSGKKNSHS